MMGATFTGYVRDSFPTHLPVQPGAVHQGKELFCALSVQLFCDRLNKEACQKSLLSRANCRQEVNHSERQ